MEKTKRELKMEDKAFDAAIAINGISMILTGLANQLDNEVCNSLPADCLNSAIYAICRHLERIADDLENIAK